MIRLISVLFNSMGEFNKPKSEEEFEANFPQKKPLMNETEAFYESSRCLFCYDAPCVNACPTEIDIPLFIKQIQTGNVKGAADTIYESNWLGNACGKVCPTMVLCEGACVYNDQDVKPIDIGRLQNYATDMMMEQNVTLFKPGKSNGRKAAIIGAGPAGIACACELRVLGYDVDIHEAKENPSGLTVHGTAPYKITNEDALKEITFLQKQLGFNINYKSSIDTKEQLNELESNYDAIFLGVGIGPTSALGMPGEDMEGVIGAVEFVEELRMKHHSISVPDNVIVLGGGNTAMDAASESARMGAENVILAYRNGKEHMGAYKFEYQMIINSGARGMFNVQPVEIVGNGKATGVKFIKTESRDGKLENMEGSEFVLDCDLVIKATGQAKMGEFLGMIDGLELDGSSRIVVDEVTFQTKNEMYFAGGDAVNGGAEVVNGAHDGKAAALGIHEWLNKKG